MIYFSAWREAPFMRNSTKERFNPLTALLQYQVIMLPSILGENSTKVITRLFSNMSEESYLGKVKLTYHAMKATVLKVMIELYVGRDTASCEYSTNIESRRLPPLVSWNLGKGFVATINGVQKANFTSCQHFRKWRKLIASKRVRYGRTVTNFSGNGLGYKINYRYVQQGLFLWMYYYKLICYP